ncbi:hypothetical protein MiSe_02730 [Microseira wollei NIES-4236]|uniref:Uncharacterized protein n=1 Tax=Microseira wollei NIES-4236 TaxID=2530354 RepID=A0AAV3X4L1_9CYAN|nr:hypothetical protein MiSe_02730 [Microseira wollei NIES-4236]
METDLVSFKSWEILLQDNQAIASKPIDFLSGLDAIAFSPSNLIFLAMLIGQPS